MEKLIALVIPGNNGNNIVPPENIPTLSPTGPTSAGGIFEWLIGIILLGTILLALGYIVYGAMNWITSKGDKQKVHAAQGTITFALVGLIIALLSIVIVNAASDFINPQSSSNPGFLDQIL